MAAQMTYDDYNTYLRNKKQAEAEHAQTGQWNAALGQQNQAIRDKYGMGADTQNAQQFENAYAWMYNGQDNRQKPSAPYDNYYERVRAQYDDAMRQAQSAREAQTKQALSNIEAQRPGIQQSAEDQARQAYVNNQRNVNMLPWQMKMMGLTGGAAESSLVSENARFGDLHGQIMGNRDNQLRELENAKLQAQLQGDYDVSALQSGFARDLAGVYQQLAAQQLAGDIDAMNWNRQTAREDTVRGRNTALEKELAALQHEREKELMGYNNDLSMTSWMKQNDITHGQTKDLMGLEQQYALEQMGAEQKNKLAQMGYANTLDNNELSLDTTMFDTNSGTPQSNSGGVSGGTGFPSNYDLQSIMALGYGSVSPQKLLQLVSSGAVVAYEDAQGKIAFRHKWDTAPKR